MNERFSYVYSGSSTLQNAQNQQRAKTQYIGGIHVATGFHIYFLHGFSLLLFARIVVDVKWSTLPPVFWISEPRELNQRLRFVYTILALYKSLCMYIRVSWAANLYGKNFYSKRKNVGWEKVNNARRGGRCAVASWTTRSRWVTWVMD